MALLSIYVTNLERYTNGENGGWVSLPASKEKLAQLYDFLQLNREEEYRIDAYESDIDGIKVGEWDTIESLNELAKRLDDVADREVLEALLDQEEGNIEKALYIYESGDYGYFSGVYTDEDLGYFVVEEGMFEVEIPVELINFIDYEAVGRDYRINVYGGFFGNGFLEVY